MSGQRRLAIVFAAILAGLAGTMLYVANTDLGGFKGRVESIASEALGRELRIDGNFSLRVGSTVRIQAAGVSVENAAWADGKDLLEASHLALELTLWSLFFGPIHIESIEVQDLTLDLQEDAAGRVNWDLAARDDRTERRSENRETDWPTIDRLALRNSRVKIVSPHLTRKTEVVIDTATFGSRESSLDLVVTAKFNEVPLSVDAKIDPWARPDSTQNVTVSGNVTLGEIVVRLDADLSDLASLAVSSASVKLDGPDAAYLLGVLNLPELASGPLQVSVTLSPDAVHPTFKANGQFGEYRVAANGWVADLRGEGGFDTKLEIKGPDLSLLGKHMGVRSLPSVPFGVRGRLLSNAGGIQFEDTKVDLGGMSFHGQGRIADLKNGGKNIDLDTNFESTKVRLEARTRRGWELDNLEVDFVIEGPNAREPGGDLRLEMLAGTPFLISGKGKYSDQALLLDPARIHVEEMGDLQGSVSFAQHDRPTFDLRLQSESIKLPARNAGQEPDTPAQGGERLIPDFPIPFESLAAFDATVDIAIDDLSGPTMAGASLRLQARLQDGRLDVSEFETNGKRGRLKGSLLAEPAAPSYDVTLNLVGHELTMAARDEPIAALASRPKYELAATLKAHGANLRELTATLQGTVQATGGAGTIPQRSGQFSTLLFEDLLTRVATAINPMTEKVDSIELTCLVLQINIEEGIIDSDPILALQTSDLDLIAGGKIDLQTESLDLDFLAQPRRGLGVGLGEVIHPFTRVGGTLSAPKIVADTKSGILHTGAGIVTGGLFPLANNLRKRFFGKAPCKQAVQTDTDADGSIR